MTLLTELAAAASDFCTWCTSPPTTPPEEARRALRHVSRLHLLAQSLREQHDAPEVEGEPLPDAAWHAAYERFGALPFQHYGQVLDPFAPGGTSPECGVGDLADDLADIYRDVWEGLELHRQGDLEGAEQAWAWSFRTHWGTHAADALHVLHAWVRRAPGLA